MEWKANTLFLILFSFSNLFSQTKPAELNKKIIVLYDQSGSVTGHSALNARAVNYINEMLWSPAENERIYFKDDIIKLDQFSDNAIDFGYPLANLKGGDEVVLYGFGLDYMVSGSSPQSYLDEFAKRFFEKKQIKYSITCLDSLNALRSRSHSYDLFDYAYPLAMRDIFRQGSYQRKIIFIVFSDFALGVNDQFKAAVPPNMRGLFLKIYEAYSNNFEQKDRFDLRIRTMITDSLGQNPKEHKVLPLRAFEVAPPVIPTLQWLPYQIDAFIDHHAKQIAISPVGFRITGLTDKYRIDGIDLLVRSLDRNTDWQVVSNIDASITPSKIQGEKTCETAPITFHYSDWPDDCSGVVLRLKMRTTFVARNDSEEIGFRLLLESSESQGIPFVPPSKGRHLWLLPIIGIIFIYFVFFHRYKLDIKFYPPGDAHNTFVWTPDAQVPITVDVNYRKPFFAIWKPLWLHIGEDYLAFDSLREERGGFVANKKEPYAIRSRNQASYCMVLRIHKYPLNHESESRTLGFTAYISDRKNGQSARTQQQSYQYKIVAPVFNIKVDDAFYSINQDRDVGDLGSDVAVLKQGNQSFCDLEISVGNHKAADGMTGSIGVVAELVRPVKNIRFKRQDVLLSKETLLFSNLGETQKLSLSFDMQMDGISFVIPDESMVKTIQCIVKLDPKVVGNDYPPSAKAQIRYVIKPDLRDYWISIDPGTTGSCICGINASAKEPVLATFGEGEEIVPSVCYYSRGSLEPKVGFEAAQFIIGGGDRTRIFASIKRCIGYKRITRVIDDRVISGEMVAEHINTYLIRSFLETKGKELEASDINKIIIAVPNIFTQNRIQAFKDVVPRKIVANGQEYNISLVEHIYEAEAVAVYLLNQKREQISNKTIMICDFGGGTINITVLDLSLDEEGRKKIEIKSRVGCSMGGETVTRFIARMLWEKRPTSKALENRGEGTSDSLLSRYKLIDDFDPLKDRCESDVKGVLEARSLCKNWLYAVSEQLKLDLSAQASLETLSFLNATPPLFNYIFNHSGAGVDQVANPAHSPDQVHVNTKDLMKKLLNGGLAEINYYKIINDLLNDAMVLAGKDTKIDRVILSGRSSLLSGLKENIRQKLNLTASQFIPLEGNELKTCVSRGAAYYAVDREGYILTRQKALANYVVNFKSDSGNQSVPLIMAGELFNKQGKILKQRKIKFGHIDFMNILQVMGALENIDDYKIFRIAKLSVDAFRKGEAVFNAELTQRDQLKLVMNDERVRKVMDLGVQVEEIMPDVDAEEFWQLI